MSQYLCPQCRTPLDAVSENGFDAWQCPAGHGIGGTLSEFHGKFQEDEADAIWKAAANAPSSTLRSPLLDRPMVAVTVLVDDDEEVGNEGPGARLITLDVATEEQFLWFSVIDLAQMPLDLPDPAPSAEDLARLEAVRAHASDTVQQQIDESTSSIDRIGHRFGSRAAALLGIEGLLRRGR